MSSWPYPYCPHLAYNNNLQIRLGCIPYTFIPDPTIDAFTNVNVKCANPKKSNIPTLSYEDYFILQKNIHNDTNFARDYYKETKNLDGIKYDNTLVEDTKEQMNQRNSYVLAGQAMQEYERYEQDKKNVNDSCRRRAVSNMNLHFQNKKEEKIQASIQNGDWLKKLYRKLEQIAKHIVEGEGESQVQKERMFLLSKMNLTAGYLSKIKVRNPKTAFQILEELRILMMKKKLKFEDQRQQQQKNKSVTMSYTTDVSQNTSQGSMLSEATSMNESNVYGQEQLVAQFCDFSALTKKWGLQNVEDVKKMLRFMLTRKIVSQAQLNKDKKIKEAERINKSLQKLNPELAKKINAKKEADKVKANNKQKSSMTKSNAKINSGRKSQKQVLNEANLNKQQKVVLDKLRQGSQFDAIGQKFSRNRNYSQLFIKKQKQFLVQYVLNPQKNIQVKANASGIKPKKQRQDTTSTCICP